MQGTEPPECPVCLQNYDGSCTVPRVLSCGHTTCESCLKTLPQKYPLTIRCPSCTQLIKYPPSGPSSLPKNIDLLRFVNTPTNQESDSKLKDNPQSKVNKVVDFLPRKWSDQFYKTWMKWILPNDAVTGKKVKVFEIGSLISEKSFVNLSYDVKVIDCLWSMEESKREELDLILRVCDMKRVCKVCGLWGDLENGVLGFVCEGVDGSNLEKLLNVEDGIDLDDLCDFVMMVMEICEAVIGLNRKGFSLGCLGLACFEFDDFGHLSLCLSEVLMMGQMVHESVIDAGFGGRRIGDSEIEMLVRSFVMKGVFVSPEVFFDILKKEGVETEYGKYVVGYGSDVWSLAFFLLCLLIGRKGIEELSEHVDLVVSESKPKCLELYDLYDDIMKKVALFLESKFLGKYESLQQIICRSLSLDPENRPSVTNIWKCIRSFVFRRSFNNSVLGTIQQENELKCLVVGDLCKAPKKESVVDKKDESQGEQRSEQENNNQTKGVCSDKDFITAIAGRKIKSIDMKGHVDCVTGLMIGGGFLFSSSFDKTVQVWSLQDFSHVQTFKGHENKVMAISYVDGEQPLCVSGDSGGGIFLWDLTVPLRQEPLKRWYEQKDWRYSGIHALATGGNGYLYTGSGDRLIKAWSFQEGIVSCTMEGHKSVVSTLAIGNGVLYSGSWDGTVRLWSLCDHSILTVFGDEIPGSLASVLSLTVNENLVVTTHENGVVKIWSNDEFVKSMHLHNGAVFAAAMEGRWLFTGGWEKSIEIQELVIDESLVDPRSMGKIEGGSVVTALLCWQGKLFVGHGDRSVKVYYHER